jgi:hypothetical protein
MGHIGESKKKSAVVWYSSGNSLFGNRVHPSSERTPLHMNVTLRLSTSLSYSITVRLFCSHAAARVYSPADWPRDATKSAQSLIHGVHCLTLATFGLDAMPPNDQIKSNQSKERKRRPKIRYVAATTASSSPAQSCMVTGVLFAPQAPEYLSSARRRRR